MQNTPHKACRALTRRKGLGRHQAWDFLAELTDGEIAALAEFADDNAHRSAAGDDWLRVLDRISDCRAVRSLLVEQLRTDQATAIEYVDGLSREQLGWFLSAAGARADNLTAAEAVQRVADKIAKDREMASTATDGARAPSDAAGPAATDSGGEEVLPVDAPASTADAGGGDVGESLDMGEPK